LAQTVGGIRLPIICALISGVKTCQQPRFEGLWVCFC